MPSHLIFHERNAFALDAVADDSRRFILDALAGSNGTADRLVIMSVNFDDIPAKGLKLSLTGLTVMTSSLVPSI